MKKVASIGAYRNCCCPCLSPSHNLCIYDLGIHLLRSVTVLLSHIGRCEALYVAVPTHCITASLHHCTTASLHRCIAPSHSRYAAL
ncbi:hypothetical protein B484DRAFT_442883 [Ochromonadaceae sp. CCMP2298]|nr:hypothetical protein B484DRAFT_442883 [Ochromonadaceae sp. CCMP2298]|mmetsp:Transcript_20987/g.46986  ORF Transcript_20987/g.46986 Transcript_20987/m.46986 type:complete len:86 (-) Transcript_20987:253-510(-)